MNKYLIECSDDNGLWKKFNYFTGSEMEVRNYLCDVIMKTKYTTYRFKQVILNR